MYLTYLRMKALVKMFHVVVSSAGSSLHISPFSTTHTHVRGEVAGCCDIMLEIKAPSHTKLANTQFTQDVHKASVHKASVHKASVHAINRNETEK